MSEKLCLQWNDFQDNVNSAFGSLREDHDFADVTLACEDGQQFDVHKVILAASSPFFKNVLIRNKNSHPLIFMRGVKSENLVAIIDFLYCGEANVFQENLNSFLVMAEELQLKGLMRKPYNDQIEEKEIVKTVAPTKILDGGQNVSTFPKPAIQSKSLCKGGFAGTVALPNSLSGDVEELDVSVRSMMEKTDGRKGSRFLYACKVCGKEGQSINVQHHIEANHLEGFALPCNLCEKTSRSRNALQMHKRIFHKRNNLDK